MKRRIQRKREKYMVFLTGALILWGLAGCKSEVPMTAVMPQNRLVIWAWDETFNVKAAKMAAEEYRRLHPDTEIEVVAKERIEIMEQLNNGFGAEVYTQLPDIVLMEDYEVQKMLSMYEDEFVVMDDYLDYGLYQDYKTELASKEGIHYGVPFDSGAAVMFYRKDYIEAAGYTEEDMQNMTWEEYRELGQRVKETSGVHMLTVQPDDLGLIRIMMQSGGSWYVTEDGDRADIITNASLQEAIHIYQNLVSEDLALTVDGWDGFTGAFQDGRVATVVSGCWIASTIKESQEQSGLWRTAAIPRMEGVSGAVNASNIGGGSWYVLKNRANSQAAAKFLKETFGENRDLINRVAKETALVTTRKDAGELDAYKEGDTFFGDTNIFETFLESTENVPVVNYGRNTYEIEDILEQELQNIMKRGDLGQALEKVQIKAQSIVN